MKKEQSVPMQETENNVVEAERVNTTEFPTVVAVEPEYKGETVPASAAHAKKKRSLFQSRSKGKPIEQACSVEESVAEMPNAEEGMKVYGGDSMDDTREVSVSQKTRVLGDEADADDGGDHATQLMLDGFESEEETEEGEDETLRRIRREKIQDFSQKREEHERAEARAVAEEPIERGEVVYPETPLEKTEAASKEEFTSRQQLGALRQKLQAAQRTAGVSLFLVAAMEIILFFIAVFSFVSPAVSMNPVTYLIVHLVLLIGMMFAVRVRLRAGLSRLFSGAITAESGVALVAILTLVHTALQFLNTTGITDGTTPVLTAVAGLSLLLMQVADKLEADRVSRTFGLVAAQGDKLTAKRIEDSALAEEIGRPAVALGEPRVTYFRKTEFCGEYISNSEDSLCANALMRWYVPIAVVLSLIVSVVYLLVNGLTTWLLAVTLFCSMICISSPALMLIYLRSVMAVAAQAMHKSKTAVVGYQAVREYGSSHAVALDAIDLFPQTSVLLHGIKTFSGTRIDEAILDAASVSVRAGGPLSHLFRRMILNKVDMLHDVDTLVYEQDMGLSGWVSGRRVLIGNRKLLDNHGIDIPSKDYEERYAKNGRQLVYLSIAGELSAMFVVSYTADPRVKKMLTDLTRRRITLLVRTCDPNITESLIAATFELNGFYVELLGAPAGRSFEALVDGVSAQEPSGIVSTGDVCDMMGALARCRRLRSGIRLFTAIQTVIGVIGMAMTVGMAFAGGVLIPPLFAVEFLGI
ncbi:MAG: hypothetical protein IKU56_03680, partial [Clostridia bacterium]|nr:hypothetical protein [Clostridia bacterium]